jgi:hypothetical protein
MADLVKPLKIENPASGGTETDPFPVEANPSEDYLSAKGLAFENLDTRIMDLDGSGNIQFKDATETSYMQLWKLRRAIYEIFDPAGSTLVSTNTEAAIKEIATNVGTSSRAFTFASYGGNANTGRFLEFFPSIDSDLAPLYSPVALKALTIVSRSTASSTCTIGFYDNTTLLYTLTHTASTQVVVTGTPSSPIFTLPINGSLKIKVASGSITKPHLYFVAQGG